MGSARPGSRASLSQNPRCYRFRTRGRFSFALATFPARSARSYRFAEDIELAVADQPVLRVGLVELAPGKGHGTEVCELRGVVHGIGLEELTMLRARKAIALLIPFMLDVRQPARGPSARKIGDRVIALDRQRDAFRSSS